jgi:hypothetical protein
VVILILIILVVAIFFVVKACEGGNKDGSLELAESDYSNVAIVVGDHQNSPAVELGNNQLKDIENIVLANRLEKINIVNATKTPDVQPLNIGAKFNGSNDDSVTKGENDK